MVVVIIYALYLRIEQGKKGFQLYDQIENYEDKSILYVLKNDKNSSMKEHEISLKYKELTGNDIDENTLSIKLKRAEEIGIVDKIIANVDDKPYVSWRINFKQNWL